jgi:hypothetical protein
MERLPDLEPTGTAGGSGPAGRRLSRRGFLAATAGLLLVACNPTRPTRAPASPAPAATVLLAPTASPASTPSSGPPGPLSTRGSSVVAEENRRPGDGGWQAGLNDFPAIRGFLDRASVAPGDSIGLRASGSGPFDARWYRLGWYAGAGGRVLRVDRGLVAKPGSGLVVDASSGLSEEPWPEVLRIEVPPDWPSGLYVVVLAPSAGAAGTAVFVVRSGAIAPASVLYVNAAATWQAYNHTGPSL